MPTIPLLALLLMIPSPGATRAIVSGITWTPPMPRAADSLVIRLVHDSDAERRMKAQLERVVRENDVDRWIETREILIDETEIPHSHPVLTLHTRHLGDDDGLLAAFLHEQFHWYAERAGERTDSAKAAFERAWPEVPVGGNEGARDRESTYLHLVVCDLELQAMTLLRGRQRAAEVLSGNNHYRWIYQRVLNDPVVRQITTRNRLTIR